MRETVIAESARPQTNEALNTFTTTSSANSSNIGSAAVTTSMDVTTPRPVGVASAKRTRTATGADAGTGFKASVSTRNMVIAPGRRLSGAMWVRHDAPVPIVFSQYWERVTGGVYRGGAMAGGYRVVAPNEWVRLSGTYTFTSADVDAGFTSVGVGVLVGTSERYLQPGESFWMNGLSAAFDSAPLAVHCDGDTPGWRWLGTPGQSESAGYPYTLESIAGAPFSSEVDVPTGVNVQLPAGPRTIISVHSHTSLSAQGGIYDRPGQLRVIALGSPPSSFAADLIYPGGNYRIGRAPVATGPVVHALRVRENRTHAYRHSLINAWGNTTVTPDTSEQTAGAARIGQLNGQITGAVANGLTTPRFLTYASDIGEAAADAVMRWLANAYGAPLTL